MTIKDIIKQIPFRELSLSRGKGRHIDKGISKLREKDISQFINLILKDEEITTFIMSESRNKKNMDTYNICIITFGKFIKIEIIYDKFAFTYDQPIMGVCLDPAPNHTYLNEGYCRAEIYDLYNNVRLIINETKSSILSSFSQSGFLTGLELDLETNNTNIEFLKLLQNKL